MRFPFLPRPDKTFLIEAGETRFRIDLDRADKRYAVVRIIHEEKRVGVPADPARSQDLGWITELLAERPRPSDEITLLTSRIPTLVAEFPEPAGGGLQGALEMEAQTETGLPATGAQLASVALPGEPGDVRAWLVQAALGDLVAFRAAVSAAGGSRLVAVGHPAGVRLDRGVSQLECWPGFILLHTGGGTRIDCRGWSGDLARSEAFADEDVTSALATPGAHVLTSTGVPGETARYSGCSVVSIDDPGAVARWSALLADACDPLGGSPLGMPLITLPKPPPSHGALVGVAAAFAAGAVLLASAHFLLAKSNQRKLGAELERTKTPAEKLATDKRRIKQLEAKIRTLNAASTAGGGIDPASHRTRMGAVLAGVARAGAGDVVVLRVIPGEALSVVLEGVAATADGSQAFATRLDAELAADGWRAALVRRVAKLLQPGGGPWSYEIRLSPDRPIAATPPAEVSANPSPQRNNP